MEALLRQAASPLWPNVVMQGETAGANMAGEELTYGGGMAMKAAEIFGLPVTAAGLSTVDKEEVVPYEIYRPAYPHARGQKPVYTKLVLQDDRLLGYIIIGENRMAGILTSLMTIGAYAVAAGLPTHVGVMLPVLGGPQVVEVLTEKVKDLTGGYFIVELDLEKAAYKLLAAIDERRAALI